MTWRMATPADVPEILELIHDLALYEREPNAVKNTADMLQGTLFGEQPAIFCHVIDHPDADSPHALAGFALWFLNYSTWLGQHGIYLEDLYVRPELRGRGLGQVLLKSLAQVCSERGYGRLEWSVLDWNEPAIDFYRSMGAVPMDEWTVWRLTGKALEDASSAPTAEIRLG
jgi:GNAT superfamily N-acetyltransferase